MEALGAVLRKGSSSAAARSEEDRLYEDIEAPKFVDFTVPEHSRPDDRSWFCTRIGCDQNHEDVDPDALYKSFVLRVMAARSPNVRLQKALNRQRAPSAMARCPQSAPAKPVKGRATKLGAVGSLSEKMGIPSKLKVHPISSLRSTPSHSKAAKRPPTTEKAMTTPRNRLRRPPDEEPFQSAKSCKARPPTPKSRTVVKALTFQTPKKDEQGATPARGTPIQELSAGMKQIKLGSNPRGTGVAGSNALPRKPLSRVRETPMDLDACRDQTGSESERRALEVKREKEGEEREPLSSVKLGDQTSLESDFDEDKENAVQTCNTNRNMDLSTVNNGAENCQNKTPNKPLKVDSEAIAVVPSKTTTTQDPTAQGTKYKPLKPTNPKPFRLRTDERGILREANLERGKPQKETQGRTKLDAIKSGRPDEAETAPSTQAKPMEDCEEKSTRKTQNKAKLAVPRHMLKSQSVTELEGASSSATVRSKERACGAQGENSTNMATTMSPRVKRAITIPREPVFHKIHMPKGCTKRRLEKAN